MDALGKATDSCPMQDLSDAAATPSAFTDSLWTFYSLFIPGGIEWDWRLIVPATLILGLICILGIFFLVRFLVALCTEPQSKAHAVYWVACAESREVTVLDRPSSPTFSVIPGGRARTLRKIG